MWRCSYSAKELFHILFSCWCNYCILDKALTGEETSRMALTGEETSRMALTGDEL